MKQRRTTDLVILLYLYINMIYFFWGLENYPNINYTEKLDE
jgi:hypothetical protein